MRIKTALLCAVFVGAMMLGGCADKNGTEEADGTSNTTTNNTSLAEQEGSFESNDGGNNVGDNENDSDPFTSGDNGNTEQIPDNGINNGVDGGIDGDTNENNGVDNGLNGVGNGENGAAESDVSGNAGNITPVMGNTTDNSKIGWGLGSACDAANRPIDAVQAQQKYEQFGTLFIGSSEDEIYLTFDEGYENGYTAEILDVLKEKGAKAVFFVTMDYCTSSPELVKRMIDEGHTVGNHTVTHPSMPDCSDEQAAQEITELHDYVKSNFGYEMTLFRFPMGEFSERCLAIVNSLGYKSVFWSFAYSDWDINSQPAPDAAIHKITHATHGGAVFLLHAVSKTNTEILPELIDFWNENNYTIGKLS